MAQLVAEFAHVQYFWEMLAMEHEVARERAEEATIVRTQASKKSFLLRPTGRAQRAWPLFAIGAAILGWLVLSVAACRTNQPPPLVYIGGPLDAVVAKMGYPQSQREFGGDTIYSWNDSYVKTRYILIHSRETCTMDVGVRDGIVKNITYNGDGGPCSELEDKLMTR